MASFYTTIAYWNNSSSRTSSSHSTTGLSDNDTPNSENKAQFQADLPPYRCGAGVTSLDGSLVALPVQTAPFTTLSPSNSTKLRGVTSDQTSSWICLLETSTLGNGVSNAFKSMSSTVPLLADPFFYSTKLYLSNPFASANSMGRALSSTVLSHQPFLMEVPEDGVEEQSLLSPPSDLVPLQPSLPPSQNLNPSLPVDIVVCGMLFCKIELDRLISSPRENVLLVAYSNGSLISWDVSDGRCIHRQSNAFSLVSPLPTPFSLECQMFHHKKHIILTGNTFKDLVLMDASNLHILYRFAVFDGPVLAACRSEQAFLFATSTQLYRVSSEALSTVDMPTLAASAEISGLDLESIAWSPSLLNTGPSSRIIGIISHEQDKNLLIVWTRSKLHLFVRRRELTLLNTLDMASVDDNLSAPPASSLSTANIPQIISARFTSFSTLLVVTTAHSSVYYFGIKESLSCFSPPTSLSQLNLSTKNTTPVGFTIVDDMKNSISGPLGNSPPQDYKIYSISVLICRIPQVVPKGSCAIVIQDPTVKINFHLVSFTMGPVEIDVFYSPLLMNRSNNFRESNSVSTSPRSGLMGVIPLIFCPPQVRRVVWRRGHSSNITCMAVVLRRFLTIGYRSGDIELVHFSWLFKCSRSPDEAVDSVLYTLRGHTSAITALFAPDRRRGVGKRMLLSGASDFSVRLWNLETGQFLASFMNHCAPIRSFIPCPFDMGSSLRSCVLVIAMDQSLSFIDIEEINTAYRFPPPVALGKSHSSSRVTAIHYRSQDDFLAIERDNGSAQVWSLATSTLDRVVQRPLLDYIIADSDFTVSCIIDPYRPSTRKALTMTALYHHNAHDAHPYRFPPHPYLFLFHVNVKKLLEEIAAEDAVSSPTPTPILPRSTHHRRSTSLANNTERSGSVFKAFRIPKIRRVASSRTREISGNSKPLGDSFTSLSISDSMDASGDTAASRSERLGSMTSQPSPSGFSATPASSSGFFSRGSPLRKNLTSSSGTPASPSPLSETTNKYPSNTIQIESTVLESVLSILIPWSLSPDLDKLGLEKLKLFLPCGNVAFATRGVDGILAVPIQGTLGTQRPWGISPYVSASRLLSIIALNRAICSSRGIDEKDTSLLSAFDGIIVSMADTYQFPSFLELAKFWQDPVPDIQIASRSLISISLARMKSSDIMQVVNYWWLYLPSVTATAAGMPSSSSLASLAAITVTSGPNSVSSSVPNPSPPQKNNFRAAIILGIIVSENRVNLSPRICKDVAESLCLLLLEDFNSPYRMAAVEIFGIGWFQWECHVNANSVLRSITSSTGLSVQRDSKGAPPQSMPYMKISRHSLVSIATSNTSQFVSWITMDLAHAKTTAEKTILLKLLGMFISKRPQLLASRIVQLVEAMIKCLDPTLPHVREALQHVVTVNLAESVKLFPNVAFHQVSQKLALGSVDGPGMVSLFDMRTATKIHSLEMTGMHGTSQPVAAISFSPDGKLLVAYCSTEHAVYFWQLGHGLLGSLMGVLTQAGAHSSSAVIKSFRSFKVGSPNEGGESFSPAASSFEWTSDRTVSLKRSGTTDLVFSI